MSRQSKGPAFNLACEDDEQFFRNNKDRLHLVRVAKIAELNAFGDSAPGYTQYLIIRRLGDRYFKVVISANAVSPAPNNTEWNAAYLFQHFAPPSLLKALVKEDHKMYHRRPGGSAHRSSGALH